MKAKYCKCKNTYCIDCCKDCNAPEYWKQGIGSLIGQNNLGAFNNDFNNEFDI